MQSASHIQHLVPAQPVFDPESLHRELLASKLATWMSTRCFYVNDLREMRAIVNDINGVEDSDRRQDLPFELDRLHCMSFETLSPVNLRECLWRSLEYVGISQRSGADLLGNDGWSSLQQRIDALGEHRSGAQGGEDRGAATSWERLLLVRLVTKIFTSDRFDICEVSKLADALNAFREAAGLQRHDGTGTTLAALRTLHCQRYDSLDEPIRRGIKGAVWELCGLIDDVGQLAFGDRWAQVQALDVLPQGEAKAPDVISAVSPTAHSTVGPFNVDLPRYEVPRRWAAPLPIVATGLVVVLLVWFVPDIPQRTGSTTTIHPGMHQRSVLGAQRLHRNALARSDGPESSGVKPVGGEPLARSTTPGP